MVEVKRYVEKYMWRCRNHNVDDRLGEFKIVTIKEALPRESVPQNRCSLREAVQMELLSGILREWK